MPPCLCPNYPDTGLPSKTLLSIQDQLKHLLPCKAFLERAHTDLVTPLYHHCIMYIHPWHPALAQIGDSKVWLPLVSLLSLPHRITLPPNHLVPKAHNVLCHQ